MVSRGPSTSPAPSCLVCGDSVAASAGAWCVRCETPHHLECARYLLGCAVFACGSEAFVAPGATQVAVLVVPARAARGPARAARLPAQRWARNSSLVELLEVLAVVMTIFAAQAVGVASMDGGPTLSWLGTPELVGALVLWGWLSLWAPGPARYEG